MSKRSEAHLWFLAGGLFKRVDGFLGSVLEVPDSLLDRTVLVRRGRMFLECNKIYSVQCVLESSLLELTSPTPSPGDGAPARELELNQRTAADGRLCGRVAGSTNWVARDRSTV